MGKKIKRSSKKGKGKASGGNGGPTKPTDLYCHNYSLNPIQTARGERDYLQAILQLGQRLERKFVNESSNGGDDRDESNSCWYVSMRRV